MSVAGFTSRGLLRMQCGEPFTLSRARPNAIRVDYLIDPFHATCLTWRIVSLKSVCPSALWFQIRRRQNCVECHSQNV